jgi:hypothetical protein
MPPTDDPAVERACEEHVFERLTLRTLMRNPRHARHVA